MSSDFVRFLTGQTPSFELATVESTGDGAVIKTPGRTHPRTRAGVASGLRLAEGDRVLILGGGKQDVPLAIGKVPYIF